LDITGLAAVEGRVWVAWTDGLVGVEERSRVATQVQLPGGVNVSGMVVGRGAAWVLAGGAILRIEPGPQGPDPFIPRTVMRLSVGFGRGYLWALEQPEPSVRRFVISRYSPENGQLAGQVEVQGVVSMTVNEAGVWLRALRWESELPSMRGPMRSYLIHVGPVSLDVVEREISNEETFFALSDGVWLGPHTLPRSSSRSVSTRLRRMDLSTGQSTAVVEVPGLLTDLSVGPAGLWGLLSVSAGSLRKVARIDADAGRVVDVFDLAEIDARPFLPPPPGPIDPEPIEIELRNELSGLLQNTYQAEPHLRGTMLASVVFEDVTLEGSFPQTEVVIVFRTHYRPELRFGRRERIWSDDGVYVADGATVIWSNLEEAIIFEPNLPLDARPDQTGTVWI